jgi:hypothetical protein
MSVQTGRVVSAKEAREMSGETIDRRIQDLAHTVNVQAEQIEAALALHVPRDDFYGGRSYCDACEKEVYPCPTALALGESA